MNFLNGKKRVLGGLTLLVSTILYILEEPVCQARLTEHLSGAGFGSALVLLVFGFIHAREKAQLNKAAHDPGA